MPAKPFAIQYQKNIGKILTIKTDDTKLEGTLINVLEEEIVLQWKERQTKLVGKGKVTVEKTETIAYNKIQEAKVKLIF